MNILDILNHIKDAKLSGSLSSQVFSEAIDIVNVLFCKKVAQGNISNNLIESYMAKVPKGSDGLSYNHQGLEAVNNKLCNNLNVIANYNNKSVVPEGPLKKK